jgi:hypothetical protein
MHRPGLRHYETSNRVCFDKSCAVHLSLSTMDSSTAALRTTSPEPYPGISATSDLSSASHGTAGPVDDEGARRRKASTRINIDDAGPPDPVAPEAEKAGPLRKTSTRLSALLKPERKGDAVPCPALPGSPRTQMSAIQLVKSQRTRPRYGQSSRPAGSMCAVLCPCGFRPGSLLTWSLGLARLHSRLLGFAFRGKYIRYRRVCNGVPGHHPARQIAR